MPAFFFRQATPEAVCKQRQQDLMSLNRALQHQHPLSCFVFQPFVRHRLYRPHMCQTMPSLSPFLFLLSRPFIRACTSLLCSQVSPQKRTPKCFKKVPKKSTMHDCQGYRARPHVHTSTCFHTCFSFFFSSFSSSCVPTSQLNCLLTFHHPHSGSCHGDHHQTTRSMQQSLVS